ncbi:MAG: TetR/AcrR family transcriptional regulator [Firmicutes bacterium]|nr:TetR/AcrR family transcriptional regulator [Bacillota bacterium]
MSEEDLRERILTLAADSAMRYGIKRLTMDELAEKLGISKKTIYTYFRSKKELIEAAIDREFDKIYIEQDAGMIDAKSLPDKVLAVLFPIFKLASKIDRIMLEELVKYHPDIWKKIDERRQERIRQMSILLTQEMNPVIRRGMNPEVVSSFILNSIISFITPENLTKMGISPAEAFKTVFTVIISIIVGPDNAGEFLEKMEQKEADSKKNL